MLKEFLQELRAQAQLSLAPQMVQFDPHANVVYRRPDGSLEFHSGRHDRDHKFESLADLCLFATRFDGAVDASFWYDADGVVFAADDETAIDKAVLSLPKSPQWLAVVALAAGKAQSQRDLIQLLRTTFRDCLGKCGDLVKNLREIRWKSAADGESSVQRGKSSIGKTIQQQVEGLGEIPEYVTLTVPYWANRVLHYVDVECSLDPDEATQTFKLVPLPGKIERATEMALDALHEALTACQDAAIRFPIYRGAVN